MCMLIQNHRLAIPIHPLLTLFQAISVTSLKIPSPLRRRSTLVSPFFALPEPCRVTLCNTTLAYISNYTISVRSKPQHRNHWKFSSQQHRHLTCAPNTTFSLRRHASNRKIVRVRRTATAKRCDEGGDAGVPRCGDARRGRYAENSDRGTDRHVTSGEQ
jgi:hypothetical protein